MEKSHNPNKRTVKEQKDVARVFIPKKYDVCPSGTSLPPTINRGVHIISFQSHFLEKRSNNNQMIFLYRHMLLGATLRSGSTEVTGYIVEWNWVVE